MKTFKAILRWWKFQERPITEHSSVEPNQKGFIHAPTNLELASVAEAIINRFKEFYSTDSKVSIRSFVARDIFHIEDVADRSRLEAWFGSASSVNLFGYAVATATPFNSPPHVRDTVLINMDRIFCDRAEDLPREVTGAMTIGESLQDVRTFLASKLDD